MIDYLNLTKPRISLLFAFTGLVALFLEGSLRSNPLTLWIIVAAIFMVGGSANALNQYLERDRDKAMARTAKKRPLPQGKISPNQALIFSIILALSGNALLAYYGGWLSLGLGIGTILFYSFYYTLWLKPRTPYNIVIGGIAGSTAPLIGWAAATHTLSWIPLILFFIIFLWTPPHFWALALCCKDDYAKVGLPMLPLVKGDDFTKKQIVAYTLILVPFTGLLFLFKELGLIYLSAAIGLGGLFVWQAFKLYSQNNPKVYWQFFGYSIVYLLLLFGVMLVDAII